VFVPSAVEQAMAWGMEIVTKTLKHASYCVLHSYTTMLASGAVVSVPSALLWSKADTGK
jgi:hypothetical protein